tara:strand:+ start:33151 stop:33330 length:180 start_codon:yes stop_codon:yes gene_type:complete
MTLKQMVKILDGQLSEAHDKIEALESELADAVETAYRRGAVEWTKSNFPKIYKKLKEGE